MVWPFFFRGRLIKIRTGGFFACFGKNLFWCGGLAVLQGFLRILWCGVVVIRGEVVVNCVVNVVEKQSVFGA
jgi:hypothetical protein